MTTKLRAVKPGETAKPETPKSINESLDGSSRDVLAAIRRTLAKKIDAGEVSSNAIAAASKELRELDRLIRLIDAAEQEDSGRDNDADESFDASAI